MKRHPRTVAVLALSGTLVLACAEEQLDPAPSRGGADNAGAAADGAGKGTGENGPETPIPAPRIGVMGEAEMAEVFIRQLDLTDANGILSQVNYAPVGVGQFEHQSFVWVVQYYSRSAYQNMMPTSRDLATFSQTTANGFFALGSLICVALFNQPYARATRKKLFGVDEYAYDAIVSIADHDGILDVLLDRFAMSSSVDLEPVRADVKKIMQDEFDEAVKSGVNPRDALEESCSVLVGSLAPYLL